MRPEVTRAYTPAGLAAAVAGMFGWGIGIVLIKLTTSHFLVVAVYRHAISLPLLVLAWLIASDRSLPWRAAAVGGAIFALHQIAHLGALRYTTAAVVTILFALQPIVVGTAGRWVTGERTSKRFYAWSIVAVAGCATLVAGSAAEPGGSALGATLAVVNLLLFSAYYLATKKARERVSSTSWLLVMTATSGVILASLAALTGTSLTVESGRELGLLAALAIGPATMGHLFITWAHPRIHAAASSAVILGVPVIGTIGTAIFVGESIGPLQVVGGLVALVAAAGAMRNLPPRATAEAADTFGEVAT